LAPVLLDVRFERQVTSSWKLPLSAGEFVPRSLEGTRELRALMTLVSSTPIALGAPSPENLEPPELGFPQAHEFERLYAAYFHHVTRWVRAFGCRPADVDDVAQETFLVARRRLADFDGGNAAGWLYRIAQNVSRAQRRRAWLRRTLFREANDGVVDTSQSPIEALEQRDARRLMQQILAQLTERRRTTFFLFEIEGYSGEEIAVLEGVSVNTVYTRLHHARRDFMTLLAAAEAAEGEGKK
jgi:RNA polymerase sigma-70 factor (ECF subfamily)